MDAYRIGSPAHPLLDGAGAAASDNVRWNSKGRYIIYAAEHYATALLEKAAQVNSVRIPRTLVYVRISVPPDATVEEVRSGDLRGWDSDDKTASQRFGDRWYDEQRSLILLVPSLAAPGLERNVLINQRHPEFRRLTSSDAKPLRHRRGQAVRRVSATLKKFDIEYRHQRQAREPRTLAPNRAALPLGAGTTIARA